MNKLHNKIICSVNLHKLVDKSAYGQCVTKNDVQNVHRQPAHKLTDDDATAESLLWRHNDVIIGHSIAK